MKKFSRKKHNIIQVIGFRFPADTIREQQTAGHLIMRSIDLISTDFIHEQGNLKIFITMK